MSSIARSLEAITAEIKVHEYSMKESVARHAWEIGKRLTEAKSLVPHGKFSSWLEENFEFTDRYAREFMKFFDQNRNLNSVFNGLEWTKIRQIMSLPESIDRSEFIEQEHVIPSTGESKKVDEMTVKELREVKKSLKVAEQRAKEAEEKVGFLSNKLQEEMNKPREVITKEVIPEKVQQELSEKERLLQMARSQLDSLQDEIKTLKLSNTDDFDDEFADKKLQRLEREANIETLQLAVSIKQFLKDAALTAFKEGALAAASPNVKQRMLENVELLESFTRSIKSALQGRIQI